MTDLAQLGIEVDSSQVKTATADLDNFNKAAQDTDTRSGAIEAAAKRVGISYDEMAARVAAASAGAVQHNATMANAASTHAKLGAAASGAAGELGHLDEIAAVLESRMLSLGNNIGIIGEVLKVIGPVGVAVAVGLGAAAVATDLLVTSANRMGEVSAKLAEVSNATGISTDSFQALGTAGAEFGLSTERTGQFLERFTAQLQGVHEGTGTLYSQLQKISPALASEMSASKDGADALNTLAKAYKSAADEAQKALIVRTAFGRGSEGAGGEFLMSIADKGGVDAVTEEVNKLDLITNQQIETWRKLGAQINESADKARNNVASIFTGPVLTAELNYYQNLLAISELLKSSGLSGALDKLAGPSSFSGQVTPINGYGNEWWASAPAKTNTAGATGALGSASDPVGLNSQISAEKNDLAVSEALNGSIGDQIAKQKELVSALGNAADATEKLKLKQLELQQAIEQNKFGPSGSPDAMAAAATAAEQIQVDNQGAQAADRQRDAATALAAAWGDVSQATAVQLDHLQNQLPVAQAIGAAAKLEAQEQATIADLKAKGVKADEAQLIAAKQYELSSAAAVASAQKMVKASQDNLDLTLAAGTADEARLKSDIAYRDAMEGGATAAQAAAISANVMATATAQAAQSAQQMAEAWENAQRAAHDAQFTDSGGSFGDFSPKAGQQYTSGGAPSLGVIPGKGYVPISEYNQYYSPQNQWQMLAADKVGKGDVSGAISSVENPGNSFGASTSDLSARFDLVDTLTQLKNSQTSDKSSQISNLQDEMAWLNTQPETIARDQKLTSLQQSIDSLNQSVVANTASNNGPGKQVIIYVQPGATADQFIKSRAQIQRAIGL